MPGIRLRAPDGRAWTLKELIQGKPLGHPSHALVVHFPVAFYMGAVAFDILSRTGRFDAAPLAATWLILGAQAASVLAVITGLVDWFGMARGSTKKRWATRHMVLQFITAIIFAVNLVIRYPDRNLPDADMVWIVLGLVGIAVLSVGQYLGGTLVYEFGMRVSTVERGQVYAESRKS